MGGVESRPALLQIMCLRLMPSSFLCLSSLLMWLPQRIQVPVAPCSYSSSQREPQGPGEKGLSEHLAAPTCSCKGVSFATGGGSAVHRTGTPILLQSALQTARKHQGLSNVPHSGLVESYSPHQSSSCSFS